MNSMTVLLVCTFAGVCIVREAKCSVVDLTAKLSGLGANSLLDLDVGKTEDSQSQTTNVQEKRTENLETETRATKNEASHTGLDSTDYKSASASKISETEYSQESKEEESKKQVDSTDYKSGSGSELSETEYSQESKEEESKKQVVYNADYTQGSQQTSNSAGSTTKDDDLLDLNVDVLGLHVGGKVL